MNRERSVERGPGKQSATEAAPVQRELSPGKQTLTQAISPIAATPTQGPTATPRPSATGTTPPPGEAPSTGSARPTLAALLSGPNVPPDQGSAVATPATPSAQGGGAAASYATYRQRLAKPGYGYLLPYAEPLLAQLERGAPQDDEIVRRLAAMFAVSHSPDGGALGDIKQASNRHHAEIGAHVAAQLDEAGERDLPEADVAPELERTARRLEQEANPLLEDDVRLTVTPGEDGASIRIAPNDFTSWWYGALRTRGPRGHTAVDRRGRAQANPDAGLLAAADAMFIAVATRACVDGAQVQGAGQASKYRFQLPGNLVFTIRLMVCPLGDRVIRPIANPTKHDHVLELSNRAAREDLGRAIAQGVGELAAIEQQSVNHAFPVEVDLLTRNPRAAQQTALSPRDRGAIAQIVQLQAEYNAGNGVAQRRIRRELMLLIEDLGIRRGTADGDARFQVVRPHLGGIADWVASLARSEAELNAHQAAELVGARAQYEGEERIIKREAVRNQALHTAPVQDRRKTLKNARALAATAAQQRNTKSAQTEASYRRLAGLAQQQGRFHPVHDPMIGGGASLAAIRPGVLLIDDRGRWQVDPSKTIAQTAAQLQWVLDAGLGDPYDFVEHPDDRVPLEAVRYWEDSIAAQADVINGRAELALDGQSRMILTVRPASNAGEIQLEVGGNPVVATGFPRESAPLPTQRGAGRVSLRWAIDQLIAALGALQAVVGAPELLARLRTVDAGDDAAVANAYFTAPDPLRLQLSQVGQANPESEARQAHRMLDALRAWATARVNNPTRVLTGDEANSRLIDPAVSHWVIAGVGGTGISAAEIVLDKNPNAYVTMVGGTITAGLADNDQFKRVWRDFGPTGQGRFEVASGQRIERIGQSNGMHAAGQAISSQRRLEPGEVAQNVDQPLTWLVRADAGLLGEAQRILEGHAQSRVTLFGTADAARFRGNEALIALSARFGPTSADRRLQVLTGGYAAHATQAQPNGPFALDAPVRGDGFIVSMGRDDQLSPVLDSMVRTAKLRDPASVTGDLMWDDDGQYLGYRVNITAADASVKHIEVTGAASRFFPPGVFTALQEQAARAAIDDSIARDAPAESGNFAGGFAASAVQTARYARQRRHDAEARIVDNYALTGARGTLNLPNDRRAQWAELVADFLARELPAQRDRLRVVQLGGGNTGDPLFNVMLGEAAIGVFKVFADQHQAQAELDQLAYLAHADGQMGNANQHSTVVTGWAGMQPVRVGGADGRMAILMDAAPGRSVDSLVTSLPAANSPLRASAVARVQDASLRVARALAEIHFRSRNQQNNGVMTPQQKYSGGGALDATDTASILRKLGYLIAPDAQRVGQDRANALLTQTVQFTAIRNRVRDVHLPAFQNANVPATCYHGDANAGNFLIDGDRLSIIDVGFARWSHGAQGGTATGANDIAKYLNSLETLHPTDANRLAQNELLAISAAFCTEYRNIYNGLAGNNNLTQPDLDAIMTIYRVEGEIAALNNNNFTPQQAVARMNRWVGL